MSTSSPDKEVLNLVLGFSQALETRASHLQSFCRHGIQVEGWLYTGIPEATKEPKTYSACVKQLSAWKNAGVEVISRSLRYP